MKITAAADDDGPPRQGNDTKLDALVTEAFAFSVDHPDGFTIDELAEHLGVSERIARDVIQRLRDVFGDDDEINLVCDPQGSRERFLYRLVGNPDDARWWVTNRLNDTHRRIRTQHAISRSMVRATDGRTLLGRRARIMEKFFRRMLEDLNELAEMGLP